MPPADKEFVLTHVITDVSNMIEDGAFSNEIEEYFGVNWAISVKRKDNHLQVFVICLSSRDVGQWTIDASIEAKLLSANGRTLPRTVNTKNPTEDGSTNWGWNQYISWDDLQKNYVVDDTVIIKAHVKILKMTGIGKKKLRDFDESTEELSDVILIVEDEKFYVSKLFLACQSSYFKSLLVGTFKESEQSEITLADVGPEDFQNFLEVLHGEPAIDDSTISGILQLADMYEAETVVRQCEEFLMEKSEKTLKEKLEISAGFGLKKSTNKCLLEIKTAQDIKSVVAGDLQEMVPSVLAALLQKSLSLQ